jgi:hypothetical protein
MQSVLTLALGLCWWNPMPHLLVAGTGRGKFGSGTQQDKP